MCLKIPSRSSPEIHVCQIEHFKFDIRKNCISIPVPLKPNLLARIKNDTSVDPKQEFQVSRGRIKPVLLLALLHRSCIEVERVRREVGQGVREGLDPMDLAACSSASVLHRSRSASGRAGPRPAGAAPRAPACLAACSTCLLYTSPSPRDQRGSRMPSSA